MHLLIRAVSLAGQPLTQAISAYFDERGGTIGRSDTNTMALPDPERRISRLQAELSRTPDGWRILNVGNANPIWHNNRPVPPGEGVLLAEGDELQIGTYALLVNYSQNDATARTITKGRAAVDSRTVIAGSGVEPKTNSSSMLGEDRVLVSGAAAPTPMPAPAAPAPVAASVAAATPASPFADLLGGPSASQAPFASASASSASASSSPFADLLGFGASSAAPSAPPPAQSAPAPAAATRLPDDFDPFADFQSTPSSTGRPAAPIGSWDLPKAASAPASASPFDLSPGASPLPGDLDLMGSVAPPGSQSLDQMFGLSGSGSSSAYSDPLADFLKKTAPEAPSEAPVGASSSVDPLALLNSRENIEIAKQSAPPAQGMGSALPDNVPEINSAMALPPVHERQRAASTHSEPPPVVEIKAQPTASAREPMSATFSFMPPKSSAASTAGASTAQASVQPEPSGAASSPFADLGLGAAKQPGGLLDDLDLTPKRVPPSATSPVADLLPPLDRAKAERSPFSMDLDLPKSASGATFSPQPVETQLAPDEEPTFTGLSRLDAPQTGAASSWPEPDVGETIPGDLDVLDFAKPHPDRAHAASVATTTTTSTGAAPQGAAVTAAATTTTTTTTTTTGPAALPSAEAPGATEMAADTRALWAAFCEGAGVKFMPPQGLNPDLMRVIGQLLHHAVDGSLKLVAARAATKQEMRAEVTVIQARRNNPLKFSPDTESAMEQLLQPPMRGFMTGPEAVADAMDDLLGHTIGTMVGMRSALEGVLARFEPAQLETKLVGHSMLDSLLPMNRRAKLWELYLQHYEAVRNEAQDDFHNLFGRAFLEAYEEQLDRLHAERHQAGRASSSSHA